jgi:hypothetical protein
VFVYTNECWKQGHCTPVVCKKHLPASVVSQEEGKKQCEWPVVKKVNVSTGMYVAAYLMRDKRTALNCIFDGGHVRCAHLFCTRKCSSKKA